MVLKVHGDFNGWFGDILCLSHGDTVQDEHGAAVPLSAGMELVAFEEDVAEDGTPEFIVAHGVVARPPESLRHGGSRWVLQVDERGLQRLRSLDGI